MDDPDVGIVDVALEPEDGRVLEELSPLAQRAARGQRAEFAKMGSKQAEALKVADATRFGRWSESKR